MEMTLFQVDAFSNKVFGGNPAAVCPLETWIPDELMQAIATENNLSETAFFVRENDAFHLRWFTPEAEVKLCGHATLASAHVLFQHLDFQENLVHFDTLSGRLTVSRQDDWLEMDFPLLDLPEIKRPPRLDATLGCEVLEVFGGYDLIAVVRDEAVLGALQPDPIGLLELPCRGIAVTAQGQDCDFVSRAFYPKLGIPEDPATGSVHCQLVPYWAGRLGKTKLSARQLSKRGAELRCRLNDGRVGIAGQAVTFMEGRITVKPRRS